MGARTAIGWFEWVLPVAELTHQLRRPAGLSLSDCCRTAPGLPLVACKPQLHCQPLDFSDPLGHHGAALEGVAVPTASLPVH